LNRVSGFLTIALVVLAGVLVVAQIFSSGRWERIDELQLQIDQAEKESAESLETVEAAHAETQVALTMVQETAEREKARRDRSQREPIVAYELTWSS